MRGARRVAAAVIAPLALVASSLHTPQAGADGPPVRAPDVPSREAYTVRVAVPDDPASARIAVAAAGTAPVQSLDWLQERRAAVLERISYPWQDLGFDVEFHGPREGLRAYTWVYEKRVAVYARPGDSVSQTAYDLAHELGHAVDVTVSTPQTRRRWLSERGVSADTPWWPCDGCDEFATGAGDFAEVFALWQLGGVDFQSRLAPAPDAAQLGRLIPLLRGEAPTGQASRSDSGDDERTAANSTAGPGAGPDAATGAPAVFSH